MSAMTLRRATQADWPAIAALLTRHRLPLDGAADHLAHFIVAEEDADLAGVGGLEVYGTAALLRSLAVERQGMGLGTRLVEALIAQARDAGMTDVVLLTTTAGRFFPRFGFTPVARDDVPAPLLTSEEFRGACPSSALVMHLMLRREELP
jgi:N-acetylglutamate synthase-like GNAT family acetyltransferase